MVWMSVSDGQEGSKTYSWYHPWLTSWHPCQSAQTGLHWPIPFCCSEESKYLAYIRWVSLLGAKPSKLTILNRFFDSQLPDVYIKFLSKSVNYISHYPQPKTVSVLLTDEHDQKLGLPDLKTVLLATKYGRSLRWAYAGFHQRSIKMTLLQHVRLRPDCHSQYLGYPIDRRRHTCTTCFERDEDHSCFGVVTDLRQRYLSMIIPHRSIIWESFS